MIKKFDTVGDLLSGLGLTIGDKLMYRCKDTYRTDIYSESRPITAIITAVYPAKKCVSFGPSYFSLNELFEGYEVYNSEQKAWVAFGYDEDDESDNKADLPCFKSNQDYNMQRDGKVEENLYFHVNSLVEIDGENYVRFLGQDYRILHDEEGEYIKIDAHYSVHAYDICNEDSDLDDEPEDDEDEDDPFDRFIDEAIDRLDSICKQLKNR